MKRMMSFIMTVSLLMIGFSVFAEDDGNLIEDVEAYFKDCLVYYVDSGELDQMQNVLEMGDIRVSFDQAKGELRVDGNGAVVEFFPRIWEWDGASESFLVNENIKSIVIGSEITEIDNSFNDLYGLESICFLNPATKIRRSFNGCRLPEILHLTEYNLWINESFNDCATVLEVFLEGEVYNSFNRCAVLRKAEVTGEAVTSSFTDCESLNSVTLKNLKYADESFLDCALLKTIICNGKKYTPQKLRTQFVLPPEDPYVYSEFYVHPTDEEPKVPETEEVNYGLYLAIGGGAILLIGGSVCLWHFKRKKEKLRAMREADEL